MNECTPVHGVASLPASSETPLDREADRRQSEAALAIARGAGRLLLALGFAQITEVPLPNGRRADLMCVSAKGEIWIVEIKSGIEDFRADQKWPEYRDYCDRLAFAVAPDFPIDVLPGDTGLILADRYGGELIRAAPEHKLPSARRKAIMLRFARLAALRLQSSADPDAKIDPFAVRD